MLETVVECRYRELCLICDRGPRSKPETEKFRLRHKDLHVLTLHEKTLEPLNMKHVKVNNEDTRTTSVASTVNLEHISHFILRLLLLNSNKDMLAGSENIKIQKINLFSVTVRNKLSHGRGRFVGLHVFILTHPK